MTTRARSESKATSSRGTQPAASEPSSTRPSTGSMSRVTSLANVVFPEPVSPTIATRRRGAMVRSTPSSAGRASGAYRKETWSKRTPSGPAGSWCTSSGSSIAGSRMSGSVSITSSTRRKPATAFCASLSTSLAVCTGATNRVTRKRKATRVPAEISPARPSSTPTTMTAALATAATNSPVTNTAAVTFWASTDAR